MSIQVVPHVTVPDSQFYSSSVAIAVIEALQNGAVVIFEDEASEECEPFSFEDLPAFGDSPKEEIDEFNELAREMNASADAKKNSEARAKSGETCGRCGGAGKILHYSHVQKGICFSCHGNGKRRFFNLS